MQFHRQGLRPVRLFFYLLMLYVAASSSLQAQNSTADHTKFDILQQTFTTGPQVTEACLSCHTEASDQLMHSIHFTWEFTHPSTGQQLGKRNVINSFCGAVAGNEPRCTSCHAGYDWNDMSAPPPQMASAVDCLVCHDRSGQYTKLATAAGHPPLDPVKPGAKTITGKDAWPVDLAKAAQSVGQPGRANCGSCHFYGGGGDNVKHGDLSSVLVRPTRAVDVHMSAEGADFTCSACHVSNQHQWDGSRYAVHASHPLVDTQPGAARTVATCESCHGERPHQANLIGLKLNDHVDKLACQTCHIPSFARGGVATKTFWDWSTAGRLDENGKPFYENDYLQSDGQALQTYASIKGDFLWDENVEPYYAWFDGQVEYTLADDTIDSSQVVEVNKIHGGPHDGKSRIWPFKRMEGRQPYDLVHQRLVYSHVWGPETETAFWTNFDWDRAIAAGMQAARRDFSGKYDFVDTYMYWPVTHMVAPASDALDCASCHSPNGRMQNVAGVFIPGTHPQSMAAMLGQVLLLATLGGIAMHIVLRLFAWRRKTAIERKD